MKLLLDMHIVVWLALNPSALSQDEQKLLASADTVPIPTRDPKLAHHPLAIRCEAGKPEGTGAMRTS